MKFFFVVSYRPKYDIMPKKGPFLMASGVSFKFIQLWRTKSTSLTSLSMTPMTPLWASKYEMNRIHMKSPTVNWVLVVYNL